MADDEEIYSVPDHPLLVIISGPSGVGKDTMLECIRDFGSDFAFVVTMTTRPKRATEADGVDYFFVSHSTFQQMIADDELLEYSLVYGDYKGIPKNQVRKAFDSGKDVMMRIDVQGAEKIRKIAPNVITIFLMPESEAELVRRLTERKSETPDNLRRRINTAREEMKRRFEFDYIVVNRRDETTEAMDEILAVIKAEHCRVGRQPITL
ncbi:MAG TPA: guanylate kinase [Thermoflexales bacterium]|nr:guanylate kinase [Thermoflexales bacterium]HQW36518.1 guanylate kinase [Thermoflexales bacterium]HQZ21296.1 guanylate kinase [Thermoflexales bacterium]HRA00802.1 guanylate kinase [Thermoflexales bacterium]